MDYKKMTVKLFSELIDVNYNQVRYMIQHDTFKFIKAIKNGKHYRYLFDPLETRKYILNIKTVEKEMNASFDNVNVKIAKSIENQ